MRRRLGAAVTLTLALAVGCRQPPPPFQLYRFDDEFKTAATVSAPDVPSSARMAEPIVWDFSDREISWRLIRGRMGFRPGELVLKGEGSTPVIVSPSEPLIDWSQYESIQIRMIAEGGREIKIRLGDTEMKQKLAPPMQYQVYRFDLKVTGSGFGWQLGIMPTDHISALVAIDFIELIPRKTSFPDPAGRKRIGKQEEYRNTLYAHVPSSVAYEVSVPKGAKLHFGIGVAEKTAVTFRVLTGASNSELYSKTLRNPEIWEDAEVDLSAYEGRNIKIVLQADSEARGAVALWANPLITTSLPKDRPNVLLYSVCTMRPDHTSLYGYSRNTTPFLKKLGSSGVVFEDCHAQATWTKASVASLLTSLYSFTHGVIEDTDTIPTGASTMAEQLRKAGYVTAAMVGNPFSGKTTGLDRGFDYVMEYPAVHRYREEHSDGDTDSAALNRLALPWLERHHYEPFFLYVLSTDPHAPYGPPARFESMFANPSDTPQFNRDYNRLWRMRGTGGGATISRAECRASGIDPAVYIKRAIDRYDAEIAHNDWSIELLAAKLEELGVLDNTLVVIASDHGEEFWEHGWTAHGHTLYQELTRTVLLMRHPKLLLGPRRVSEPVQLIDLMPTVLDLLHIEMEGVVQGQSLVPLTRGSPFQRRGPVMSSRFRQPNAKPGGVPESLIGTFAWLDPDWKFIYRDQAERVRLNRVELYNRRTDRTETNNVAPEHPEEVERLMAEVNQWIEAQKQVRKLVGPGGKTTLDSQTIERLRSLGYLGGKTTE